MLSRCVVPLALLAFAAQAEVLEFGLKAGKSRPVTLASAVDDSNFTEPRGYAVHGRRARSFIQRIALQNTGEKPLTGRLLTIDERDFSNMEGLQSALGLSSAPHMQRHTMERLFTFWKDHRSHGGTGAPLANEPFATLNFWGYTLCGEDTQALARLAHASEIPARLVQLNGHIAAEYRYDGDWHIVDGDQNAVYLRLDNQTLASADDIRADPFLALRTKVFGKHSKQDHAASAFNTALIEHVALAEPKPIKVKAAPAPLHTFMIHPGESLIWHCDLPPEDPVAQLDTEKPEVLRDAALATIQHQALASRYARKEDGTIAIASPFPIFKVVNHTTGEAIPIKSDPAEPVFRASVPVKGEADKISIFSQCSRLALPLLHRGENLVKLDSKEGSAQVAVHFAAPKNVLPPSAKVAARTALFAGTPVFAVTVPAKADRLWWQISSTRDFTFVAPSLEGVAAPGAELRLDPLTATFLSPGTPYFIRLKARRDGVWGEWSEHVTFHVAKPRPPVDPMFESAGGGFVRLQWKAVAKDLDFLIYGSNRKDFMPEAFAATEIVAMDHLKVVEERENKNQLAVTKVPAFEFTPKHRFYRIISRRGEAISVPGSLLELPAELAKDLPPPTILQVRAAKDGTKDIYRAREEKLPQP